MSLENLQIRELSLGNWLLFPKKRWLLMNVPHLERHTFLLKVLKLSDFGVQGFDYKNIFKLREINDADKIVEALKANKNTKTVVVRGDYIGLELTIVLRLNNIKVDMVYPELWCMPCLLIEGIVVFYKGYYKKKGVNMIKGTTVFGFDTYPNGKVMAVKLKEGRVLKADIVVIGVGAIPLTSLFEGQVEIEKREIKISELNNHESRRVFKKSPES